MGAERPPHLLSGECTRVQAEAMAGFFCRKTVGEKPIADFRRDATAIVDNVNLNIAVPVALGVQRQVTLRSRSLWKGPSCWVLSS